MSDYVSFVLVRLGQYRFFYDVMRLVDFFTGLIVIDFSVAHLLTLDRLC